MLIIYRFKIKIYHYLHDIEIPRTKIVLHYIKNLKVKNTLYKFILISVLSLKGRYYNCHERAQRARDNYGIVTRVIQLISPHHSCDNLILITYLCLYQVDNRRT